MSKLSLADAIGEYVLKTSPRLWGASDIALLAQEAYQNKSLGGRSVRARRRYPIRQDIRKVVQDLLDARVLLIAVPGKQLYCSRDYEASVEELVCALEPLCYLSHLTAMDYYGITNRRSSTIFCTSPSRSSWRTELEGVLKADGSSGDVAAAHPDQPEDSLPRAFSHYVQDLPDRMQRRAIRQRHSTHWRPQKGVQGEGYRTASVGLTFVDMVRAPDLCGGIHHVVECYAEHGRRYRNQILSAANAGANKLEKSRIGYLMEEHAGVTSEQSEALTIWSETAVQRGGSRRLDPTSDYAPSYSEKWGISINL